MSKRVLILVGIPDFDYNNQMSAVASFLKTVKNAYTNVGYEVDFGSEQENQSNYIPQATPPAGMATKVKALLKNWKFLYQSLVMRKYLKGQTTLLNKLLKRPCYDLVIEFHTAGSLVGKTLAEKWECNFSVIFDSPVAEQYLEMHGTKSIYWKQIINSEKQTLEAAEKVMVYSPACETYIRKTYSIKGDVKVLPCVIEKQVVQNNPVDGVFNICFIGSFLSWHKVDLLVHAFKIFNKKYPEAKLQLIGFGQEWEKVKQLVAKLNLTAQVDLPGFVSEEELMRYKRECTVAIMPGSNWYGSPLKLFEYAQSGIPFLAPETPTVASVFMADEHCLYIRAADEVNAIVEQLTFLYNNPEKRREIGTNAKAFVVANFEEAVYAKKLVSALSS